MKRFNELDEGFICKHCGKEVLPLGYSSRDHCPYCLYSIHIDINPGDRQNTCLGMLRPIGIEKYKDTYNLSNLRLIRHNKNLQQGAARNTGLKKACGNYIWFVDVDDIIMPGFLAILQHPNLLSDIDVFQFNAIAEDLNGNQIAEEFLQEAITAVSGIDYLEYEANIRYENRIRATWSKWYRRDYLIHNNLYFQEGVYWEDVMHTLKCIYLSTKFTYLPKIGYIYVQTPNSDMRGIQNGRKFADTIRFCVDSFTFLSLQKASTNIISFQKLYYERVLRKYKTNLHLLPLDEYEIFETIVSNLNLSIIEEFCTNDEHNWIMSSEGRLSVWNKTI